MMSWLTGSFGTTMKTPRVSDFDPDAKERALKSPLDQMPAIEKPAAPKKPLENEPVADETQQGVNESRGGSAFFPDYSPSGPVTKEKGRQAPVSSTTENLTEPSSRIPEFQKTRFPAFQKSSKQENQNAGIPETQKAGMLGNVKRGLYTKATYRLSEEALDAIGEAKRILKRRYQLKVNMEEVVEVAVLEAFKDLEEKQEKSSLVSAFSGKPENKKT